MIYENFFYFMIFLVSYFVYFINPFKKKYFKNLFFTKIPKEKN